MEILESLKQEYIDLKKEIEKYNHHYYNLDESLVSDFEYDNKIKRLKELEENFPEFVDKTSPTQVIGGVAQDKFKKVKHSVPMLSLSNTYNMEDLEDFDSRIQKILKYTNGYVLELKLDGLSISLIYQKGSLVKAITRGDGTIGEDVTSNIMQIDSIPKKLSQDIDIEVRGEIVLPLSQFNRINEQREEAGDTVFANPRNAAAGTIRQLDSSVVKERKLDCYIYYIINPENYGVKSHVETMQLIEKLGFKTTGVFELCNNIKDISSRIDYWDVNRKQLDYETDGLVIKVNDLSTYETLGYTAKSPRWAIAYKFKAEQKETKVKKVTYQVGRTGVITPVAEFEAVEISGSVVKRASLHNFDEIERLGLKINDTVLIEKAAEIIPKVLRVITEKRTGKEKDIVFPTTCPSCDFPLYKEEGQVAYKCKNENCLEKVKRKIEYFVSRDALNIDGLGSKIVNQFVDHGLISNVIDIFYLKDHTNKLLELEKMGQKKVDNLINSIENSKNISFDKLFYSLGIEYVGKTTSKLIVKQFGNIQTIQNLSKEELEGVEGIGDKVSESIYKYFRNEENLKLIDELIKVGFNFSYEEEEIIDNEFFKDKKFLATGKLENFSREQIKDTITKNGGIYLQSISSNLDYLIVGGKESTKVEKARKLNITILSEQDILDKLKK